MIIGQQGMEEPTGDPLLKNPPIFYGPVWSPDKSYSLPIKLPAVLAGCGKQRPLPDRYRYLFGSGPIL